MITLPATDVKNTLDGIRVQPAARRTVLHITGPLNYGGVETWLLSMLGANRDKFAAADFKILPSSANPGHYDKKFRELGVEVEPLTGHTNPLKYGRRLWLKMKSLTDLQVVHSHVYEYSGIILFVAWMARVPVRIAHSHNAKSPARRFSTRHVYALLMRYLIKQCATDLIACSGDAAHALFGRATKFTILPYGVDFSRFPIERTPVVRRSLGLADYELVIGNIGRLVKQKNQMLLLDILSAVRARGINACLVILGEGPEEKRLRQRSDELGLTAHTHLIGVRSDIPEIMGSLFDLFIFPSYYEGLGIAAVEAQAANLPIVLSDAVPELCNFRKDGVWTISLKADVDAWVNAACEARQYVAAPPSVTLQRAQESVFSLAQNGLFLAEIYGEDKR